MIIDLTGETGPSRREVASAKEKTNCIFFAIFIVIYNVSSFISNYYRRAKCKSLNGDVNGQTVQQIGHVIGPITPGLNRKK